MFWKASSSTEVGRTYSKLHRTFVSRFKTPSGIDDLPNNTEGFSLISSKENINAKKNLETYTTINRSTQDDYILG